MSPSRLAPAPPPSPRVGGGADRGVRQRPNGALDARADEESPTRPMDRNLRVEAGREKTGAFN